MLTNMLLELRRFYVKRIWHVFSKKEKKGKEEKLQPTVVGYKKVLSRTQEFHLNCSLNWPQLPCTVLYFMIFQTFPAGILYIILTDLQSKTVLYLQLRLLTLRQVLFVAGFFFK